MPRPLWIALATAVLIITWIGLRFGVPVYQRYSAIQEINRLGGDVETSHGGPEWLRKLVGDERMICFDSPVSVFLFHAAVSDECLVGLGRLTSLQRVTLEGTPVTDSGLARLQGLTELRELNLESTLVTDAGLIHLKEMYKLEDLQLSYTAVSDAGLVNVSGLTNMRILSLNETQVTDAGLIHLQTLTGLKMLSLIKTRVTQAGTDELRAFLPNATITRKPRRLIYD